MIGRRCRTAGTIIAAVGLLVAVSPGAAEAQDEHRIGVGAHFHGYDFGQGLGASAADLLMFPVAYHAPITDRLQFDVYGTWARGQVEQGGTTFELAGPTDAQIRGSYQATPWALVTLSANLPSGDPTHDRNEAIVASVLATDLLGFREANWGTGFALTPGVATATRIGEWGVGVGASYRATRGFEPEEGSSVTYEPGNETRFRFGVDRNVGEGGKFTAGFTFQNFDTDQFGGRNLFEAGNRLRGDASLSFRTGGSTWTVFGSNTWREQGDVRLQIVNQEGETVGDTITHTSSQNLAQAGIAGSVPLGSSLRIRPQADIQVQTRSDIDGAAWIASAGGDVPLRLFGFADVFPRGRFLYGQIVGADGRSVDVWGGEFGATIRLGS